MVHGQHYTAVISLKVYVRAGIRTDTRNIISEFKVTALCLTCSRQLREKKKKTNLTGAKERHLTFPRVMHSETSQVEKLYFIIYKNQENEEKQ